MGYALAVLDDGHGGGYGDEGVACCGDGLVGADAECLGDGADVCFGVVFLGWGPSCDDLAYGVAAVGDDVPA